MFCLFLCRDLNDELIDDDEDDDDDVAEDGDLIDLTKEGGTDEDEDEDEVPEPLAWRLLKKVAERRNVERREEDDASLYNDDDGDDDGKEFDVHSSPPDYSSKTDQELAKEMQKHGMKRLTRGAMIDALIGIWTEKIVERGDAGAYSQRLEEELVSLSQRNDNASTQTMNNKSAKRKRKNTTITTQNLATAKDDNENDTQADENCALHAKLARYIKSNRSLYAKILRMDPINIDSIKKQCERGLNVRVISKVKLVNFLESRGVPVMQVNANKKKKKTKSIVSPIPEEEEYVINEC